LIGVSSPWAVTAIKGRKYTYAKQREYYQFPGRFVVCMMGTARAVTELVEL
jgi:hypothetical protein